ncbi:MAG: hypothetical protein ACYCSQ_00155 [bacterium]
MSKIPEGKNKFTERDMMIFNFLSLYGYADFEALYMLTRYFYPCSKSTFKERIIVLKQAGYLKINQFNMPGVNGIDSNFNFMIIGGNNKTFAHLGFKKPNIKIFKSNFYHEFFIIRTLAKCKENGNAAYSEKMKEYPFNGKDIRPDVFMPDPKLGFEIETSIKRNWLEYARKFAVLQDQLDKARFAKKEPEIKKLIYLVVNEKDKFSLAGTFQNLKSKSINKGNNFKTYLVPQTIDDHVRILTVDEFYDKDLSSF